jgi:class 3 adenylate cyclase
MAVATVLGMESAGRRPARRDRADREVAAVPRTALADLIVAKGDESILESHRREIGVVFCDLRGFTAFAERAEPEEVMGSCDRCLQNFLGTDL